MIDTTPTASGAIIDQGTAPRSPLVVGADAGLDHEEPHDYYRYTEFALRRFCDDNSLEVVELRITGGAPEVLIDVSSKVLARIPRFGGHAAAALQGLGLRAVRVWPLATVSQRTAALFPLGYVLVARKKADSSWPHAWSPLWDSKRGMDCSSAMRPGDFLTSGARRFRSARPTDRTSMGGRRCEDQVLRIIFRTAALSYPGFILVTTMMSAQLVSQPAVVLLLATFGGLAGQSLVGSRTDPAPLHPQIRR